jgi:hypothetical protein
MLRYQPTYSQEIPSMKRRQRGAKRRARTLQTWSLHQAEAATPYIRSVLRSLREHHLALQACQLDVKRLAAQPGKPNRSALIAKLHAEEQADRVADQVTEAAQELADIDVYCLDPADGQALIPFVGEDQLAWYLFDLFDERKPLRFWRYESDPIATRRPITALQNGETGTVRVS